jgi:hypothetical protein
VERNHGQVLVWVVAAVLATLALVRFVGGREADAGSAAAPVRIDRSTAAGAEGSEAAKA